MKNMNSHPAGKPLSQEAGPQSRVLNVNAALRSNNGETPGWPVHPGRNRGAQRDCENSSCLLCLIS